VNNRSYRGVPNFNIAAFLLLYIERREIPPVTRGEARWTEGEETRENWVFAHWKCRRPWHSAQSVTRLSVMSSPNRLLEWIW